jgi:hypothetical protein
VAQKYFFVILFNILSLASSRAETNLIAVTNLNESTNLELWKNIPAYTIPSKLISNVSIEDPTNAFLYPLEDVFFHNLQMVVCYLNCEKQQNIQVDQVSEHYSVNLNNAKWFNKRKTLKENGAIIRQNTVYYWIDRMFSRLEEMGFTPSTKLKIYVDRAVPEIESRGNAENNAFYNPEDNTLSFLPAHNGLLSKLSKDTLRPSGMDPTVAVHEAGHFVFQELTQGNNLNEEIGGLNEGFADYLAMIVLNTSKIGTIMLSGKTLRDAQEVKIYFKNMEVHDLGNVFSSALWNIRNLFEDKLSFDRIVIESVRDIGRNPYATAFDFSSILLAQMATQSVEEKTISESKNILLKSGLIGKYNEFNTALLLNGKKPINYLGASIALKMPEKLAKEYGLPTTDVVRLSLIDQVNLKDVNNSDGAYSLIKAAITEDYLATPIWLYLETSSNNLLSAYDLTMKKIVTPEQLKYVRKILENYQTLQEYTKTMSHKTVLSMVVGSDWMARLKVKERSAKLLNVNNTLIPVTKTAGNINLKFLGRLASIIVKPIKEFDKIVYFTSKDPAFKGKLPSIGDEGYLLGYEYSMKNGVTQAIMIDNIKL